MALQISNCYNYTCINVSPPKYLFFISCRYLYRKKEGKGQKLDSFCFMPVGQKLQFCPNSEVKKYLLKAGLGMKKIRFNVKDGQTEVLKKISSDEKDENDECIGFPALKNCGGFELMRSQANN